ncbi:hypothetical protein ABPG72_020114 [Tetrahymena utriculariae]
MTHLSYYQIGKIAVSLFKKGFKKPLHIINWNKSLLQLSSPAIQPPITPKCLPISPKTFNSLKADLKKFASAINSILNQPSFQALPQVDLNELTSPQKLTASIIDSYDHLLLRSALTQEEQTQLNTFLTSQLSQSSSQAPSLYNKYLPLLKIPIVQPFKPVLQTCSYPTIEDFQDKPLYLTLQYPIKLTDEQFVKLEGSLNFEFHQQKYRFSNDMENVADLLLSSFNYYCFQFDCLRKTPNYKEIATSRKSEFLNLVIWLTLGPDRDKFKFDFDGGWIFIDQATTQRKN